MLRMSVDVRGRVTGTRSGTASTSGSDNGPTADGCGAAAADPASLPDEGYEALLGADGPQLAELCELADSLRRQAAGDDAHLRREPEPRHGGRGRRATGGRGRGWPRSWPRRMSSARPRSACRGRCPPTADDDYLDLIAAVKAPAPGIHLHAFRPAELLDGAARRGLPLAEFLTAARQAGLGSVPGTAARILDDDVRAAHEGRPGLPVSQWVEVIEAAHRAGLTSTATMVFGHVETPAHQVAHLRLLAGIQDRTGGFTEFIAMPFVPAAAAVTAPGPGRRGMFPGRRGGSRGPCTRWPG